MPDAILPKQLITAKLRCSEFIVRLYTSPALGVRNAHLPYLCDILLPPVHILDRRTQLFSVSSERRRQCGVNEIAKVSTRPLVYSDPGALD